MPQSKYFYCRHSKCFLVQAGSGALFEMAWSTEIRYMPSDFLAENPIEFHVYTGSVLRSDGRQQNQKSFRSLVAAIAWAEKHGVSEPPTIKHPRAHAKFNHGDQYPQNRGTAEMPSDTLSDTPSDT